MAPRSSLDGDEVDRETLQRMQAPALPEETRVRAQTDSVAVLRLELTNAVHPRDHLGEARGVHEREIVEVDHDLGIREPTSTRMHVSQAPLEMRDGGEVGIAAQGERDEGSLHVATCGERSGIDRRVVQAHAAPSMREG